MTDNDIDIIRKIQAGRTYEFEQIVNKYKDKGLTLAMRILKNKDDAEDALQEAFIKVFKAINDKQFEERSKFSTYFYRIVYNSSLDYYKKHNKNLVNTTFIQNDDDNGLKNIESNIDRNYVSHYEASDKKTIEGELQNLIDKFLVILPAKYSVILNLFYLNELSHEEISGILRLPLGTVKNRIFRAKDKLKELILQEYSYETIQEFI